MAKEFYPPIIRRLPKADIPFPGIEGWIAQGKDFQVVFFEITSPTSVASHSHGAQFGIVLKGKLSLSIEGKTLMYQKGDTCFIPPGAVHQAEFHTPAQTIDFFAEAHRHKTKNA